MQQNRSVDVGDNISPVALADDDDDTLKKMQGQMLFFSSMLQWQTHKKWLKIVACNDVVDCY